MFTQSLILVQSWPLSSSYVFSEFNFGSELTIVVLLCFLRVLFCFRVDHCRPLMFSQSLILVQSWPGIVMVTSEPKWNSEKTQEDDNGHLWTKIKPWENIRGRQCRVNSEPKSNSEKTSSYVYLEFDFGSELTIVVLLCLLRVWFWFRVDHCRPLMFSQSLILVQSWPLSSSYVFSEFDFGTLNQIQTLSKHKRMTMVNSEPK
jgi:hypothetical protein